MRKYLLTFMAVLLCSFTASAHDFEVNGIYYNITSSTNLTVAVTHIGSTYNSYRGAVTIPSTVTYNSKTYSVTSIGESAFMNCFSLTSITIPEGVTSIGEYAFYKCSSLTSITIPKSVTSIGEYAFALCSSLESITIPEGVTSIREGAFSRCSSLTAITIPNRVTSIGKYAFYECSSLTSITIPKSVTSIGEYAFVDCSSLTSITIPKSVTSIGDKAFSGCTALKEVIFEDGSFTLSLGYNYYYHSGTGQGLFYDCPLESVYLGRNLSYNSDDSYGYSPFYNKTKLTSLTIGENVTSIGNYAFHSCSGLTSITIPENSQLTSIGEYAFYDCNPKSINIPEGVTSIGDYAFYSCRSLTSINIPENVMSIGERAFYNCSSLTSVHVSSLEAWCNIDLKSYDANPLYFAKNLYIDGELVTELAIPNSVTAVKDYAFYNCSSLTSITIPESSQLTSIGYRAFYGCSSLTAVTIPESVTSIGNSAFYGCSSLTSITIPEGVTSIGDYALYYCSSLTSITIPESVTSIGECAFSSCSSLTSITIPEGVTWIGNFTFSGCSSLTSITIPESVTSIGRSTFSFCSSLTSITIPESVTSIGLSAFSDCSSLTTIILPKSVTSIGKDAFFGCSLDYLVVHATNFNIEEGSSVKIAKLLVPEAALDFYQNSNWKNYCQSIESIEANLTYAFISNPSFEGGHYNCDNGTGNGNLNAPGGWQVNYTNADWGNMNFRPLSDGKAQDGNQYFEFKADTYHTLDMSQKLHSLPAGTYGLTAAMRTERADQVTNQHIYAKVGDKTYTSATLGAPISSAWNAVDAWQTLSVEFTLGKAGSIVIGATSTGGADSKGWFQIDNFRLSALVNNVSLNQTSAAIMGGETLSLSATVSPDNAINKTLTWTSSNTAVATVDSDGKVKGVGSGTAIITAKAGSKSATCEVKVTIPVSSISLNQTSAAIKGGETLALAATINPSNATDKSVTWSSDNTAVATVDSNGKVTGVDSGTATITATAGEKSATCEVNVTILVSSISLDKTTATIYDGETLTLSATVSPNNATDKTVTWSSNNTAVAMVDSDGQVTGVGPGTAIITAKAGDQTATCEVSVKGWVLDYATGHLMVNDDFDEDYPWSDVLSAVASVEFGPFATMVGAQAFVNAIGLRKVVFSENLKRVGAGAFKGCIGLKELDLGEVVIIGANAFENCDGLTSIVIPSSIRSIQNYVFADCDGLVDVTIPNSVTAIGEGAFSECDELPSVVIPNSVTSIASKAFANCKKLGKVTLGVQVGSIQDEAFIGCEKLNTVVNLSSLNIEKGATEHGYVAYYANTVVTEGLFLDFEKLKLIVGESATLTATLISKEDYTIKWSTSNSAVAAVSNGKVTAKSAGTATITATAGGETATCVVTVEKPDMANGEYYLYDVDTKKFLSRGEYKGTCATVDKYGIPLVWTPWECSLKFLDSNLFLFETDDNNIYTDDASTGFVFEATDGGYLLKSQKSDCYLTIVDGVHTLQVVSVTDDTDAATVWQPMTKEEHDDIVAGYVNENYSNVLKAAEIPIATEKFLSHVNTRVKTDKTSAIGTARFNGSKGSWTYTGVNGKGTYGVDYCQLSEATGYHTQTITGLEKGIYKVTMQGFERSGSWERCNELAEQGYEITTATLIANGEEVNLKSWYSGKSDECNPDNTKEAVAKFTKGEYLNEVYTYVGKDGTLTLTVNMPSRVDGSWLVFNNFTLTHYSSKKDSGVESSVLEAQGSQPIYDLMGRRVENTEKGIYIVNGKKVVIK